MAADNIFYLFTCISHEMPVLFSLKNKEKKKKNSNVVAAAVVKVNSSQASGYRIRPNYYSVQLDFSK